MPTDPFVAERLEDEPRQEPNLAPGVRLPAAGRWRADRPGDLVAGQPTGAFLGSPGPNVGYALTLAARFRDRLQLREHEHADDALAVVAEIAMKRAALFGRAPVAVDVEFALELLGYNAELPPEAVDWRPHVVRDAGHDYVARRGVVDCVPESVLRMAPNELGIAAAAAREALHRALDGPAVSGVGPAV
jgi:hypothetical protein